MTILRRLLLIVMVSGLVAVGGLFAGIRNVSAHATTETFQSVMPAGGAGYTCSGEVFTVFGSANNVLHETTAADGSIHFDDHFSTQHMSGIALPSGTRYEAPNTYETITNVRPVSVGGYELTVVGGGHLIGPGPDNNDMFHYTVHLTVSANGDITADTNNILTFVCQ